MQCRRKGHIKIVDVIILSKLLINIFAAVNDTTFLKLSSTSLNPENVIKSKGQSRRFVKYLEKLKLDNLSTSCQ